MVKTAGRHAATFGTAGALLILALTAAGVSLASPAQGQPHTIVATR